MEEKLHRRWVKIGGKKGSIFDGNFQSLWRNLNSFDYSSAIYRKKTLKLSDMSVSIQGEDTSTGKLNSMTVRFYSLKEAGWKRLR